MEKKTQSAAYEQGSDLLETLHGGQAGEQMVKELEDICPDFVNMTLEWALAGIMGRGANTSNALRHAKEVFKNSPSPGNQTFHIPVTKERVVKV